MALFGTIILMFVIGYGISLDVENLTYAVLDRDQTVLSQNYALNLSGSRYFIEFPVIANYEELERRIQDIRTSERRFYQKITDIYATSIDYDPTLGISIDFFKTVQNKMHWAITGQTAAEIIHSRADAKQPNMGLTTFRGAKVRKQDVSIAKNYLNEDELAALNNLVEQYLIFAQGQAMRRIPMTMQDWVHKLDGFLTINDRDILTHAGRISHELAKQLAEREYEKFHHQRLVEAGAGSDFDQAVKQLETAKKKVRKKPGKA